MKMDIWTAIEIGDLETLKELLEQGEPAAQARWSNWTLLMQASRFGNLEIVKILVQAGACVNEKDDAGQTALLIASYYGHLKVVEYLVEMGADVNIKDRDDQSPLSDSIFKGDYEITRLLLNKGVKIDKLAWKEVIEDKEHPVFSLFFKHLHQVEKGILENFRFKVSFRTHIA